MKKLTFGQTVKKLRLSRDPFVSQERLAQAAGISPGYVGLLEVDDRGSRPSKKTATAIGSALNLTLPEMEELLRSGGLLAQGASLIHPPDSFGAMVDTDPFLSDEQREILKLTFESWLGKDAVYLPQGRRSRARTVA